MIKFLFRTFIVFVILITALLNFKLMLVIMTVAVIAGFLIGSSTKSGEKPSNQAHVNARSSSSSIEAASLGSAALHGDDYDVLLEEEEEEEKEEDDDDDDDDDDEVLNGLDDDYDSWPDNFCRDEEEEKVRRKFCIRCNQSKMIDNIDWEEFKHTYPEYMTEDFYRWAADYLENVQFENNPYEIMGEDWD